LASASLGRLQAKLEIIKNRDEALEKSRVRVTNRVVFFPRHTLAVIVQIRDGPQRNVLIFVQFCLQLRHLLVYGIGSRAFSFYIGFFHVHRFLGLLVSGLFFRG
jgi:hypothetical protein